MGKLVDDYCDSCEQRVANHECDSGILCCECFVLIYGENAHKAEACFSQACSDFEDEHSDELSPV